MITLKPEQRRRLACEQAIYSKGFSNFRDCADHCNVLAKKKGLNITFNRLCIQQYVGCHTNLSMARLKVLAELLGVTNYSELDEVFVAPKIRGQGLPWISENGNIVMDLDMSRMDRFNYRK